MVLPTLSLRRPQFILLDATGIKVYGEGECSAQDAWEGKAPYKLHITAQRKIGRE